MSLTFQVSDKEEQEAKEWVAEHIKTKHNGKAPYAGAIGSAFGWKFVPTGLGMTVTIYCMCGEQCGVTDIDNW